MLLGPHRAGRAGRRARGAGRHSRDHGPANRPAQNRLESVKPGPDGFMEQPINPTARGVEGHSAHPQRLPDAGPARRRLAVVAALGPAHLPWLFLDDPPEHWPAPTLPEVWIIYRDEPGHLELGHRPRRARARAISLRGRLRLHPGRDQLVRRPPAARGHRPRVAPALPDRRHQVHRAILGARGLGAPPAGGRARASTRAT